MDDKHVCVVLTYCPDDSESFISKDFCFEWDKIDDERRKILHDALDEWFAKSKGTGEFVVGWPA